MLTARNVLAATLLIATLSIVGMAISLWRSMEPSRLAADTFGTRARGQRGVVELLEELKVPISRSLLPPNGSWDRPTTLVIWAPHQGLMQLEPAYLQKTADWVKAGGRLVVALPRADTDELVAMAGSARKPKHEVLLLEELGLPKVHTELVSLDAAADSDDSDDDSHAAAAPKRPAAPAKVKKHRRRGAEIFAPRDSETETTQVACGGDLGDWQATVGKIDVPLRELQVLDTSDEEPAGWLKIKTDAGEEKTLVASYRAGQGQIVLVADPQLLENRLLGQADNSLLAWRLLVVPDRPVVWDEFYHGLTIRGNPLYLLRREPFGALMAGILILIAVVIWRQAIRFGPPGAIFPAARRTLAEYIETMARLFQLGRRSQPFLLAETRSGTLWLLRSELGLNPGQEKLETITAVLRRKHPDRARRLTDAVAAIDRALAAGRDLPEKETVLTLQRISACR